jgi:hypothetical protein
MTPSDALSIVEALGTIAAGGGLLLFRSRIIDRMIAANIASTEKLGVPVASPGMTRSLARVIFTLFACLAAFGGFVKLVTAIRGALGSG